MILQEPAFFAVGNNEYRSLLYLQWVTERRIYMVVSVICFTNGTEFLGCGLTIMQDHTP
jgi:hypothetical protein